MVRIHDELAAVDPRGRLAVAEYAVPSGVRLEGGRLYWWKFSDGTKLVTPTPETLREFVNLAAGNERDVLRYARHWGMLYLCRKHLKPVRHEPQCEPLEGDGNDEGEPVSEWVKWAKIAASILNVSQELDKERLGQGEDWDVLYNSKLPPFILPWHESRSRPARGTEGQIFAEKAVIANLVNQWLEMGDVRPSMEWGRLKQWESPLPRVNLYGAGLVGALAVHILELSGRYAIAACSECRKFYHPKREPKSTQRRYCPVCVEAGIPLLRASRKRNQKRLLERQSKTKKR